MTNEIKLSAINQKFIQNSKQNKETVTNSVEAEPKKVDKKKLAVGIGAAAGIAALVIGGILYFRSGKGQKVTQNIDTSKLNPIAQPKIQPDIEKAVDAVDDNLEKMFSSLNNPKAVHDNQGYAQTLVYTDKNSIESDLSGWIEKRKHAVMEANGSLGKFRYNVPDEIGIEKIKPHNYTQTSDIFIQTRLPKTGFPNSGFTIIDDKLTTFDGKAGNGWFEILGESFNNGYKAGIDKEGRACVIVNFIDSRQDAANRRIGTTVLLRSKNDKFNQDQLDLINMFEHLSVDEIATRNVSNPLGLALLVPEKDISKIDTKFEFNKNMFLSIIKHYADKHSDFVSEVTQGKTAQRLID